MSPLPKLLQSLGFIWFGTHAVGASARLGVVLKLVRAHLANRGKSATTFGEQLVLIEAILRIPKETAGDIAEFGCFKGMSSVALSIGAKLTGRRLRIFDSFEGLPEPEIEVHNLGTHQRLDYKKGSYAGTLDEVRSVIARHGEISCCEFVKGFYSDTLKQRPANEPYALIFEDADLVESVRDVLRFAWPKLGESCLFFCHEARDLEVVKLFFDDVYWNTTHRTAAPGLVGAGLGLPIDSMKQEAFGFGRKKSMGSCLGYTVKQSQ